MEQGWGGGGGMGQVEEVVGVVEEEWGRCRTWWQGVEGEEGGFRWRRSGGGGGGIREVEEVMAGC